MRRTALAVLIAAFLLVVPGSKLEFPPEASIARADPALSGAITTDIVNGDFSGEGLGEVGTPPTNNDFETTGGTVGTPPSNNGFGTGDFTDWTVTGTPTIQTGGPNGDYARLDASEELRSASFTVASNAQSLTWQMAAVNAGTFQVVYRIWHGAGHTSGGTTNYIGSCPTTCTNWNAYSIDAVQWRGQSIRVEIERYLGDLKLDEVAVQTEAVPSWDPASAGGHRVSRETGGPSGAYAKTTTTAITSQAYTLSADAQEAEVDLKVDTGSGSYTIQVLSGPTYSTSTTVYSGAQADSSAWGTKKFGIGGFAGQSIKFRVTPSNNTVVLLDKAAISKNVVPGWAASGSGTITRSSTSGIPHFTSTGDVLSPTIGLDRQGYKGNLRGNWFRIEFMLFENWNNGGSDLGSILRVKFNGATITSYTGSSTGAPYEPVRVWLERYFFVTDPSDGYQPNPYPGALKFEFWGPTVFG
ncbi:MAG: hypothetical protein WD557_16800 [Dehalococcoidia bacterium]